MLIARIQNLEDYTLIKRLNDKNSRTFFAKFKRLECELKEVISEEDKNTAWLYSRHEDFIEDGHILLTK